MARFTNRFPCFIYPSSTKTHGCLNRSIRLQECRKHTSLMGTGDHKMAVEFKEQQQIENPSPNEERPEEAKEIC